MKQRIKPAMIGENLGRFFSHECSSLNLSYGFVRSEDYRCGRDDSGSKFYLHRIDFTEACRLDRLAGLRSFAPQT